MKRKYIEPCFTSFNFSKKEKKKKTKKKKITEKTSSQKIIKSPPYL